MRDPGLSYKPTAIFLVCLVLAIGLPDFAFGAERRELPRSTPDMAVHAEVECVDTDGCRVLHGCGSAIDYAEWQRDRTYTAQQIREAFPLHELPMLEAGELLALQETADAALSCVVETHGAANVRAVASHLAYGSVVSREILETHRVGSVHPQRRTSGTGADGDVPDCHPATQTDACPDAEHLPGIGCEQDAPGHAWIKRRFFRDTPLTIPEGEVEDYVVGMTDRTRGSCGGSRAAWRWSDGIARVHDVGEGCHFRDTYLKYRAPQVDGDTAVALTASFHDEAGYCATTTLHLTVLDAD